MPPMDDRLWDQVWERELTPPERNVIARAVWFGRPPSDAFEARVGAELAHRWRRQAISLALLFGFWTVFWGALVVHDFGTWVLYDPPVAPINTALGLAAIAACAAVHRRMGRRPLPTRS